MILLFLRCPEGRLPRTFKKYLNRSANWQNIWAHNLTSLNFTGFLPPRLADGTFNLSDYNPALCEERKWQVISYEATPLVCSPFSLTLCIYKVLLMNVC